MIYDIVSNIDREKLFHTKTKSNRFSGKMQEWDLHQIVVKSLLDVINRIEELVEAPAMLTQAKDQAEGSPT